MLTHAWYGSYTTAISKTQRVTSDGHAGSFVYQEIDDAVITGHALHEHHASGVSMAVQTM